MSCMNLIVSLIFLFEWFDWIEMIVIDWYLLCVN